MARRRILERMLSPDQKRKRPRVSVVTVAANLKKRITYENHR
jgi:hypothetical protein